MTVRFATNDTVWGFVPAMTDTDLGAWRGYLDDVAAAGYAGIEHSPGRAPAVSVELLGEELARRDLRLAGLGLYGALETPDGRQALEAQLEVAASFATALGAEYLYVIDAMDAEAVAGNVPVPVQLDDEAWEYLIESISVLNERAIDRCGLPLLVHPHEYGHVDSLEQIERLLDDTEAAGAGLLFDTGHCVWRGGDPAAFYARHRERIGQIHLKNVDLKLLPGRRAALMESVASGAFADIASGDVDLWAFRDAFEVGGYRGWLTVEMLRGPAPDAPRDAAEAALNQLRRIGFGGEPGKGAGRKGGRHA